MDLWDATSVLPSVEQLLGPNHQPLPGTPLDSPEAAAAKAMDLSFSLD